MTFPKDRAIILSLSHFDKIVLLILVGLISSIVLIILLGDRVGVTLDRVGPSGVARSTAPILLQFSELMNRDTLNSRLRVVQVQPGTAPESFQETDGIVPVLGSIRWNGKTAFFQPTAALIPGASYTVILDKGVSSETGRDVLSEYRFTFQVRHPHIAYLSPSTGMYNIWIADPNDLTSARQVTFTSSGIYDYSISPDGSKIAFSERNSNTGASDIKTLDLDTGIVQQLTNCPDANCTTPTWSIRSKRTKAHGKRLHLLNLL